MWLALLREATTGACTGGQRQRRKRPQDRAKDSRHHHGRRTRGGSARSLGEDTPANTLTLNFRPPEL